MKERTVKSAEAAYASFGAPWPYGGADRSTRPRRRLGEVGFSPYPPSPCRRVAVSFAPTRLLLPAALPPVQMVRSPDRDARPNTPDY
jgi:hypothetical protein